MAHWLYEAGIGEARAALVEGGGLLEMLVEPDDGGHRAGAILPARLAKAADATGRGRVVLDDGVEMLLAPVPPRTPEGTRLLMEVVREAWVEPGGVAKPAKVRIAADGACAAAGPDLLERVRGSGLEVRERRGLEADPFEAAGWSEAWEAAASGIVAGAGALLRISLTPAMTLIDVDGGAAAAPLAAAGAALAGETIRRFGIVGSIGIDLPTLAGKAERQAAAAALDAALPPPFERTGVNGFGFLQLIRRRVRPSLPERIAAAPAAAAARALRRRAEQAVGRGRLRLDAGVAVAAVLRGRPDWLDALGRRAGTEIVLREDAALSISACHAQREHP